MLIATRHDGLNVTPVALGTWTSQPSLPASLLVNPGLYKALFQNQTTGAFEPKTIDFSQPGLYQLLVPVNENVGQIQGNAAYVYNYIVAKTAAGVALPLELAKALAWLVSFGNGDDPLSAADTIAKAQHSNINVSCGNTAEVLATLATSLGIPTRYVHVVTGGQPNYYNDGHTILEMQVGGVWKMFDSSLSYVFRNAGGDLLNVNDACRGLPTGAASPERIAPFKYTSEAAVVGKFNVLAWMHAEGGWTEDGRLDCVERLYQIPFVNDQNNPTPALQGIWGYLPPGMEGRASYITGLGYKLLTEAQFLARFYP